MSKYKTIAYIKYGKLITEIDDKITNQNIKDDIFKFLFDFPGILIYPDVICQLIIANNILNLQRIGSLLFFIPEIAIYYIRINFDGKNNFQYILINKLNEKNKNIYQYRGWISIDDVNKHSIDFYEVIEKS